MFYCNIYIQLQYVFKYNYVSCNECYFGGVGREHSLLISPKRRSLSYAGSRLLIDSRRMH